jgi:hypothetical protein
MHEVRSPRPWVAGKHRQASKSAPTHTPPWQVPSICAQQRVARPSRRARSEASLSLFALRARPVNSRRSVIPGKLIWPCGPLGAHPSGCAATTVGRLSCSVGSCARRALAIGSSPPPTTLPCHPERSQGLAPLRMTVVCCWPSFRPHGVVVGRHPGHRVRGYHRRMAAPSSLHHNDLPPAGAGQVGRLRAVAAVERDVVP